MEIKVLPDNIDEAVDILKVFFSESIDEIRSMSEKQFRTSSHFGAGMFIRNSWFLWWYKGHGYAEWPTDMPKLNEWFNSIGIVHADDMSSIVLTCLHRNITGVDYGIADQVERYKKHWREQGYPDGIPKMGEE